MAKVQPKTANTPNRDESQWRTFLDTGDGDPVRYEIAPWTATAVARIDDLLKDKKYIDSLGIDWSRMPKSGTRKELLRRALMYDHILRDWTDNVLGDDGETKLEVNISNKVWLTESQSFGLWAYQQSEEIAQGVRREDEKNSNG